MFEDLPLCGFNNCIISCLRRAVLCKRLSYLFSHLSRVSTVMLLNFNINFMEMSLNAFLWLDSNKAFYFQIFICKWQPYPISYHRNDTQIVFRRKFSKIASIHYGPSAWHSPWLLSECNAPKGRDVCSSPRGEHSEAHSAAHSLPSQGHNRRPLRKENIGANSFMDTLLKHKKVHIKAEEGNDSVPCLHGMISNTYDLNWSWGSKHSSFS